MLALNHCVPAWVGLDAGLDVACDLLKEVVYDIHCGTIVRMPNNFLSGMFVIIPLTFSLLPKLCSCAAENFKYTNAYGAL